MAQDDDYQFGDLVVVGKLFYEAEQAGRLFGYFLLRCYAAVMRNGAQRL